MQARLQALKQLRQSLKQRMSNLVLKAPAAGAAAKLPATPGETLRAGQQAVVLVQRGTLRTYLYLPRAASDRLHQRQTLPTTLPNGTHVPMRISKVYPSMQAAPEQLQPATGKPGNQGPGGGGGRAGRPAGRVHSVAARIRNASQRAHLALARARPGETTVFQAPAGPVPTSKRRRATRNRR
ncbi:MAG TPA: HlyD family efflux transporter periplasmic adaptor subunit [Gammaproteobacteria bacterium]|nr:HlyD family efflux transporter periplasmic adaptor subunit [Gammaproteobacteria bacterium]